LNDIDPSVLLAVSDMQCKISFIPFYFKIAFVKIALKSSVRKTISEIKLRK